MHKIVHIFMHTEKDIPKGMSGKQNKAVFSIVCSSELRRLQYEVFRAVKIP